jgi:hypothetical protein
LGTSQFYIHETAVVATVGEDGILTITYDVALRTTSAGCRSELERRESG